MDILPHYDNFSRWSSALPQMMRMLDLFNRDIKSLQGRVRPVAELERRVEEQRRAQEERAAKTERVIRELVRETK